MASIIHECSRRHWTDLGTPMVEIEVLYCGERYRCDERQLALLYDGWDPEDDLGLTRIDDDDR
jgi:hypothetical protein